MNVRIITGAQAAYACINYGGISLDVRLSPGRSAANALRQWAQEQNEAAIRLQRDALLASQAAAELESDEAMWRAQA